jgi:hypothetical protein
MQSSSPQIDPIITEHLESLRVLPSRKPQAAERGRAAFLSQAQVYAQAVSSRPKWRLGYWSIFSNPLFHRKERFSMFTTLATLFTVLALALGGTGATVYAAQGSLPGEALYQLKIQSEDFRLTWGNQEMEKIALALQFANRRMEEVQAMLAKDQTPPESVMLRLQNQLDTALRLAAGLDDEQVTPALGQIRQTLERQERILAQLQENAGAPEEALLLQIRDQVRLRLSWVEEAQSDPALLRNHFGKGAPAVLPSDLTHPSGDGFGPGPFITGTPTPGSGYGPGPGLQATCTCTPQSGMDSQSNPGPGNGASPGPQPSSTCTPQAGTGSQSQDQSGDGLGPGSQPDTQPGDGASSGSQPFNGPGDGTGSGGQPANPGSGPGSGNKP